MGLIFQIIKAILKKFGDMLYSSMPDNVKPPQGLLNKLKRPFPSFSQNTEEQASGSFIERIKKKALQVIKKAFGKILSVIGKVLAATWDWILIIFAFFLIGMMLVSIMGAFGAFQGKIVVNMDKFQELNQDEQVYMDAQNTNELRKAYYQLVSETSFYQMFNLEDMNPNTINPFLRVMQGITNNILPDSFATLTNEDLSAINKGLLDSQAFLGQNNILGLLGFDQRYIYSDANKNALKYMKSAQVIGIEKVSGVNPKIDQINDYFRDYYNREKTFMLSETLLSEMNRVLFGEFRNAESIVYPEAFAKPVPFVNDFYRIQTDPESDNFGEPYVYVTQRIGEKELMDATGPYYGKDWLEGIIYSRPSKLVYDYAVVNKNTYHWSDDDNDLAKQINWGNISKYGTYEDILDYGDGTEETVEKIIRLYWLVKDSDDGTGKTFNITTYDYGSVPGMNPYNEHMTAGINDTTYDTYFDGPYTRLIKSGNTITVDPSSKIQKDQYVYVDGEGNHVDANTGVKVRENLNRYPTRHLQLAPMYDEDGYMNLSSRVLFNKTFVQKKSIKESYRHFPEYYSQLSEFIDIDLDRLPPAAGLTAILDTDSILPDGVNTYCDADMWEEDQKKPFQQRKCSILRKYTGVNGLAWLKGKFAEMGTAISNAVTGNDAEAELGVSSEAMFYILRAYEDYLVETGEYGVAWDYKYYTASEFDLALAKAQYIDIYGWREVYLDSWNDKGVYKDTLDTVKALDNARTIQTQYVPTAIISGESAATKDGNVNINNIGYGWRIKEGANLDNPSGQILERVAGEASLEYPVYSTGKMKDIINDYLYGSIVYGPADFKYEWDSDEHIVDKGQAEIEEFYDSLDEAIAEELAGEYNEKDYRNKDYVWNPDADVYRPDVRGEDILKNLTSSIKEYSSDGKVTYRTGKDDNLPLEVKSVRDYGLGSVLSYLEGLRVVYQAGVFMDEAYSQNGLEKAFTDLGITEFSKYKEGYYPRDLLDKYPELLTSMRTTPMTIEDLSAFAQNVLSLQYAATDEEYESSNTQKELMEKISQRNANGLQITGLDSGMQGFIIADNGVTVGTNVCRNCEAEAASITDPVEKERYIDTCRQEGGYYNNELYECNLRCQHKFDNAKIETEEDETKAQTELTNCQDRCKVDWPDRSTTCSDVDTTNAGLVYAYSPYITPSHLSKIGEKLFGWLGYDNYNQVQFLDPLQYYIEWFDYFANKNDVLDKTLSFITGEELVSQLDPKASSTLRAVQNDDTEGFNSISVEHFGNAGSHIVGKFKEDFYNKYTSNIQPFKLISETESYRVYMIEEAVTFLGTFTYTYKDDIMDLGTGGGNTQVISMAYADRYYYMSNYIFSIPYINYEIEVFDTYRGNWSRSKPSCPTEDPMSKAKSHYNGKSWYNPFTWFQEELEIKDADLVCNITEDEEKDCTPIVVDGVHMGEYCTKHTIYKMDYDYVASVGKKGGVTPTGADAMRIDTLDEVNTMLSNATDSTLKDRVMIKTKVFESLQDWAWSIETNASTDFKADLTHDYEPNYASGDYYTGDEDNHYAKLSQVNKNMKNRPGYRVKTEDEDLKDTLNLPDDLNMDIDYDAGIQTPVQLNDSDLETILKAAKKVDSIKTTPQSYSSVAGSTSLYAGVELTQKADNIGVGLLIANREKYGYPIPLFRHFSGSQREILPRQKGSYFNGETLESWQSRLIITSDSSSAKIKHVDDEKYHLQNYLYGYITNFETYVPFDVKSDYDLMSRGREAYHSTNVNMESTISATSAYADEIFALTESPAWKETIEKFNASNGKVTQSSISQVLAGLIEVEIERAPTRALKILNSRITDESLRIKYSNDNQALVANALKTSGTDTSASVETRKVTLTLENGDTQEFDIPFLGAGAIFYDYDDMGDGTVRTDAIAPGQVCGSGTAYEECFKSVTINITSSNDDRLNRQSSIEFVSTKFGKLLRKYGDTPKAIMAYFYGEEYTDKLIQKAEQLGKGSNWSNNDDSELIAEVLRELTNNNSVVIDANKIDVSMYTSSVIAKTLSYVKDVTSKTTLTSVAVIPANGTGVDIGNKAEIGQKIYNKWAGHINTFAPMYGVDPALLAAILTQESMGNSLSGICDGDNITTDTMMGTRQCTKLNIGRYNGGGGVGQIHHFCDGGGQLPSRSSGTCERTISSNVIPGKTLTVRQALPSRYLKSMADLPSYLAMDDRYGDIPLAFEWAVIYISNSLKTYDGDVFKTLVAYNAGGGTVTSFVNSCGEDGWYNCYANSPKYGQKHNYVKLVLRYFNEDLATNDLKFSGTSSSLSSMLSTKFELKTGEIHYNRDLFSYQNSGVEFYKPRMTMSRDDVKMLLTNNYNFGKDVYEPHANKYDLLSLFTQREVYDRSGAQGGGMSWIGMNAAIGSLGQKSTRTIPAEFKFAHIAPLIPMNSPTGRDLSSERISSQFGMRNLGGNEMHKGIDIAIPVGTPLYSVAPGRVAVSAFNDGGYGWYVKVEHVLPERLEDRIITSSDNKQYEVVKIHTVYAHNSSLKVKVGDVISDDCSKITDGARCINIQDPIAYSGNTGRSYGPHLHFEVDLTIKDLETGKQLPAIRANRNVDPLFWLTTQWNG